MIWYILGIIAIIFLLLFFSKGSNAVWGGLTMGVVIGIIVAIIFLFLGKGFHWQYILKVAIVGTIIGSIAELVGIFGDKLRKK